MVRDQRQGPQAQARIAATDAPLKTAVEEAAEAQDDLSNGWESVAWRFVEGRSFIGAATVRAWSRKLPAGAAVLDLGCGAGVPITKELIDAGFEVWGIDASPTLAASFRRRFPQAQVACEAVEASDFFGRTFDGIVAVGLLFLLRPEAQRAVINHAAAALKPGGRFLFTAPTQALEWLDASTGRPSVSLGDEAYRSALAEAGLPVLEEYLDEAENNYYEAGRHAPKPDLVGV